MRTAGVIALSDILHLGCGEDYRDDAVNVDVVPAVNPDVVHDLDEHPWPFDDNSFEVIIANHAVEHLDDVPGAFREIARILRPGGCARLTVPLGLDARTDPTHKSEWTWETPAYFASDAPYDYGWDLPLALVNRDVNVWYNGPGGEVANRLLKALVASHGPGKWLSSVPGLSGEMTAVYRRQG